VVHTSCQELKTRIYNETFNLATTYHQRCSQGDRHSTVSIRTDHGPAPLYCTFSPSFSASQYEIVLCCERAKSLSSRAEILQFYPDRPEAHLVRLNSSYNYIFTYVTCTPPKPEFLLLQLEWSPICLQSALIITSLRHVLMHKCK
jgi:hypothetical protein